MIEYLKYAGILAILVIVQKTLISLIDVTSYRITPDIVLIGMVYIAINKGKITGSITGFVSGLILDLFSFSFIGLMALAKSFAGFFAGFFSVENKIERYLNSYIFTIIVSLASLINNVIYYTIYFQGTNLDFADIMLRYVVPTTVYTAIFSVFPIIFTRRRRLIR
jgi:rod shape-determining protein MreD